MADDPNTVDPELLQASSQAADKAAASYAKLSREKEALIDKMTTLKRVYGDNSKQVKELQEEIDGISKSMAKLTPSLDAAQLAFIKAKEAAQAVSRSVADMRERLSETAVSSLGLDKSMLQLQQSLVGAGIAGLMLASDTGKALLQPFSEAKDVIGAMSPDLLKLNEVFSKHAQAQDLVNIGYLGLGKSMDEVSGRGNLVIDSIQKTAAQFFISGETQKRFVEATRMVPGALDAVTTAARGTGQNMTQLAQYLLVARGAGIDATEAAKLLNTSFKDFGEARLPEVAKALVDFKNAAAVGGVSVEIASSQIQQASAPLAIFGRHISEAQNLWTTFKTSLTGVPVSQVGELTRVVSSGIAGMSLNTQAFVAQMSGMARGASALGGALRMELEMRQEGGMEKNLERVQQAISRLGGGRIITLQEAANSPALEMQFQLQRQLAGQMLGVQGSAQQSRVLEVLQNVEKGGITSAAASKDMQSLMSDGQKAQNASTTAAEKTAMGIGRMNEFMRRLVDIESAAGSKLAGIGEALGARSVGERLSHLDVTRASRSIPMAGRAIRSVAGSAFARIEEEGQAYRRGFIGAGSAEARRTAWMARRTVSGEAPINPSRPMEQFMAEPLRPALDNRSNSAFAGTGAMPIFYRKPELEIPKAAEGGAEPTRKTGGRAQNTEAETYIAEPIKSETIDVHIICKDCLRKEVRKIVRGAGREFGGETE